MLKDGRMTILSQCRDVARPVQGVQPSLAFGNAFF